MAFYTSCGALTEVRNNPMDPSIGTGPTPIKHQAITLLRDYTYIHTHKKWKKANTAVTLLTKPESSR